MSQRALLAVLTAITLSSCVPSHHQPSAIFAATLSETDVATLNISTDEMDEIIRRGDSIVLDTRPRLEWAISHIPTAVNVAPKPGTSISLYVSDVAEIERIAGGDKQKPLVLYCNGPFCGKSKRLAGELLAAGYANVRRYQLGAPVWRALGKVMVIEAEGVRYVFTTHASSYSVAMEIKHAMSPKQSHERHFTTSRFLTDPTRTSYVLPAISQESVKEPATTSVVALEQMLGVVYEVQRAGEVLRGNQG